MPLERVLEIVFSVEEPAVDPDTGRSNKPDSAAFGNVASQTPRRDAHSHPPLDKRVSNCIFSYAELLGHLILRK